jgi:hypothetical protein
VPAPKASHVAFRARAAGAARGIQYNVASSRRYAGREFSRVPRLERELSETAQLRSSC